MTDHWCGRAGSSDASRARRVFHSAAGRADPRACDNKRSIPPRIGTEKPELRMVRQQLGDLRLRGMAHDIDDIPEPVQRSFSGSFVDGQDLPISRAPAASAGSQLRPRSAAVWSCRRLVGSPHLIPSSASRPAASGPRVEARSARRRPLHSRALRTTHFATLPDGPQATMPGVRCA